MQICENIKRLRENRNMTQKELAKLSGISEGMIKQYETNVRTPKQDKINQIASALGVSPEVLVAPRNNPGEDMHSLFRVFRNCKGSFDTEGNLRFDLKDITLWFEEWKRYQQALEEADGLKDEIDRNNAIASAEDRFNYWMDIYPRSASLKGDYEELYKKHRESL